MKRSTYHFKRCFYPLEPLHKQCWSRIACTGILLLATGCSTHRQAPVRTSEFAPPRNSVSKERPPNSASTEQALSIPSSREIPEDLEGLIQWALEENRGLRSTWEQWQAARQAIPQASALPDPTIRYGYFIQEVETRVGPQQQRVGVAQTFPWFGQRKLATSMADEKSMEAWATYQTQRRELVHKIRSLWADWDYFDRATALTQDNIQLVRRLEQVAQARLRSGEDALAVVQAQLTLARLEEQVTEWTDRKEPIVAQLNGLLNRPSGAPLPSLKPSKSWSPETWKSIESTTAWQEHPAILRKQAALRRQEAAVQLARKKRRPQFTLGLDLIQTDSTGNMDSSDLGKDPLMVSAMFNLPIWEKKNRAAVAQAQAQEAAARHALDEESNQLHAARSEAHFALSDALRREALHEDTLRPLAESALQVAEQAYRTGQSSFQEWIDALQLLLDLEHSLLRAQTDQALAHATLEQLLGTPESKPAPINTQQTH